MNELNKLKQLYSVLDITSLSHKDTQKDIENLCSKATLKKHGIFVGGVCVFPEFIPLLKKILPSEVKIVSVAAGFPDARTFSEIKYKEVELTCKAGANEIDIVLPTGKWIENKKDDIFEEIKKIKSICAENNAKLKVILETGFFEHEYEIDELSKFAIYAGADFIKTSTGKNGKGATPFSVQTMAYAIQEHYNMTGLKIGIKPSGGIRTIENAFEYIELVSQICGEEWIHPELFRIGSGNLVDEILKKI